MIKSLWNKCRKFSVYGPSKLGWSLWRNFSTVWQRTSMFDLTILEFKIYLKILSKQNALVILCFHHHELQYLLLYLALFWCPSYNVKVFLHLYHLLIDKRASPLKMSLNCFNLFVKNDGANFEVVSIKYSFFNQKGGKQGRW